MFDEDDICIELIGDFDTSLFAFGITALHSHCDVLTLFFKEGQLSLVLHLSKIWSSVNQISCSPFTIPTPLSCGLWPRHHGLLLKDENMFFQQV